MKQIEVTDSEFGIIIAIMNIVEDVMEWDKDLGRYSDKGNFLLSMTKKDMKLMRNLIKKLDSNM